MSAAIKLTISDRAALATVKKAAKQSGLALATWARVKLVEAAKKETKEQRT